MYSQVFLEIPVLCKALAADRTLVRFLARMHPHVDLQMTRILETLPADAADERRFPVVDAHVGAEAAGREESLGALIAGMRPVPGVGVCMELQTDRTDEGLAADVALVRRPFVGVDAGDVVVEIVRLDKLLSAEVAEKLFLAQM